MGIDYTQPPYSEFGAFAVAAGRPDMSGREIPQIRSTQILTLFSAIALAPQITSNKYLKEAQNFGDNVYFQGDPDVVVEDYTMYTPINLQIPRAGIRTMPIDKAFAWGCQLDVLAKNRMDVDWMSRWRTRAAVALKKKSDTRLLEYMPTAVHVKNAGAAAGLISGNVDLGTTEAPERLGSDNILFFLNLMNQVLDEQEPPEDVERFAVFPNAALPYLFESKLADAAYMGDATSPLKTGRVIDSPKCRFQIFCTNRLHSQVVDGKTVYDIPFGLRDATGYGVVIDDLAGPFDHPSYPGKIIRGVSGYGRKVMFPEYLGAAEAYFAEAA